MFPKQLKPHTSTSYGSILQQDDDEPQKPTTNIQCKPYTLAPASLIIIVIFLFLLGGPIIIAISISHRRPSGGAVAADSDPFEAQIWNNLNLASNAPGYFYSFVGADKDGKPHPSSRMATSKILNPPKNNAASSSATKITIAGKIQDLADQFISSECKKSSKTTPQRITRAYLRVAMRELKRSDYCIETSDETTATTTICNLDFDDETTGQDLLQLCNETPGFDVIIQSIITYCKFESDDDDDDYDRIISKHILNVPVRTTWPTFSPGPSIWRVMPPIMAK